MKMANIPIVKCGIISVSRDCFIISLSENRRKSIVASYKEKFGDYTDPARVIVSRTEGTANYNALLFVPSHRPYDFYTKDYEKR